MSGRFAVACATLLLASLIASAALAQQPVTHEASGTSTATVAVQPDGTVAMAARNVRFVPYTLFNVNGDRPTVFARLATVTIDLRRRSDAEGVDPASTVAVTIDDLSGPAPRRLADFTDPGSEGKLLGERYFSSTVYGCCGGIDRHSVRATETGRLLFHATGAGDLGRTAWADMPNARPPITRWAAFDGEVDEAGLARGLLGRLAYGGEGGAVAMIELSLKAPRDTLVEKNLELSSGADLGWIDGKHKGAKTGFQQGDLESMVSLWVAEGAKSPADIGGFSLALRLGKLMVAVIPVVGDRLMPAQARVAPGFALALLAVTP